MAAARNVDEEKWVQDNYLEPRLFDFIGQAFVGIPDSGDHGGEFCKYPRTPEELHPMNDELDLGPSLDEIRTLPMQNISNYSLVSDSSPQYKARGRIPSASTPLNFTPDLRGTAATQARTHHAPPCDTFIRDSTTLPPDSICYPTTNNQLGIAYGTNLRHDVNFHRDLHFRVATLSNEGPQDASPVARACGLPTLEYPSEQKKDSSAETGTSRVAQDGSSRALERTTAVETTTPQNIGQKRKREFVETGTEPNQGNDHHAQVMIDVDQGGPASTGSAPTLLPAVGLATPRVLPSAVQQLAMMYPTAVSRPMASQSGLAMSLTDVTAPWHAHQRSGLLAQTGPYQNQQAAGQPSIDQHHRDDVQVEDPKQCGVCGKIFRYPKDKRRHVLIHGEPQYHCDKCSRPFHREDHKDRHQGPCRGAPYVRPRTESVTSSFAESVATSPAMSFSSPPGHNALSPQMMRRSISDSRYMIPGQRTSVSSAPRTPAAQTRQVLSSHGLGIISAGSIESTSSAVFSQGPPFDHTFTPLTAPTSDPMSRAGFGSSASTGDRRGPMEDSPLLRK